MRIVTNFILLVTMVLRLSASLAAQDTLPPETRTAIDKTVAEILAKSGAPSTSVAVVKNGAIAYVHAYGSARLNPTVPATPEMRYSIGSVSKQFTAAAILMLVEEGKLSLDDKLVRWLPELTRANEVTIRELLSMTSGYQDFWPQDYVMPMLLQPVTPQEIVNGWAKKPLDFEPGTKWQYSNTNYVIAGMIVEKVAGMPVIDLLQKRVFRRLQMTSVANADVAPLGDGAAARYMRYALGPPRPAPKEASGWLFAAGELAMTAQDLALWDISMIDKTVLQPSSYRELETEVPLKNGVGSLYGLGVSVGTIDDRRLISHGGEISGFTARNDVYPDERAAVVVLTNLTATSASQQIATKIGSIVFAKRDGSTDAGAAQMRHIFDGLQQGKLDRSLFTSNANGYFTDQALQDFAFSLGPLGAPQEFAQASQSLSGAMTLRRYLIRFPQKTLRLTTFIMPDGKIEEYQIAAVE